MTLIKKTSLILQTTNLVSVDRSSLPVLENLIAFSNSITAKFTAWLKQWIWQSSSMSIWYCCRQYRTKLVTN